MPGSSSEPPTSERMTSRRVGEWIDMHVMDVIQSMYTNSLHQKQHAHDRLCQASAATCSAAAPRTRSSLARRSPDTPSAARASSAAGGRPRAIGRRARSARRRRIALASSRAANRLAWLVDERVVHQVQRLQRRGAGRCGRPCWRWCPRRRRGPGTGAAECAASSGRRCGGWCRRPP